jgi:DNA-binding LacI/PurR family transcriptional regulator
MSNTKVRSVFDQTYDALLEIIEDTRVEGQLRLPSEAALAETVGVAPLTVRRALARLARERRIDRQHGRGTFIRPREAVRTIMVIVEKDFARSFDPEYTGGILRGIGLEVNERADAEVHLMPVDDSEVEHLGERMLADVQSMRVDGFIIAIPVHLDDCLAIQKQHVPFVLVDVDFHRDDLPSALLDHRESGRLIGQYLADRGCKRAALAGGPLDGEIYRAAKATVQGMAEQLGERAPQLPETHLVTELGEEDGRKTVDHLLASSNPPDAIVTMSDCLTRGVVAALRERGLDGYAAPEIIGYVDTPEVAPGSYLHAPSKQCAGRQAAKMLFQLMDGEKLSSNVMRIQPEWVEKSRGL